MRRRSPASACVAFLLASGARSGGASSSFGWAAATQIEASGEGASMSREHAEFRFSRRGWLLRDLDSTNGTWLNEERLESSLNRSGEAAWHPVRPGDSVRMGDALLG